MLMPGGGDLEEWPCVLGHAGWLWQGAGPALAPAARVTAAAVPSTQGFWTEGRMLLPGRSPPKVARAGELCLSCLSEDLLTFSMLLSLHFLAGLLR